MSDHEPGSENARFAWLLFWLLSASILLVAGIASVLGL